jgi:pentatricopeptide repeat protein
MIEVTGFMKDSRCHPDIYLCSDTRKFRPPAKPNHILRATFVMSKLLQTQRLLTLHPPKVPDLKIVGAVSARENRIQRSFVSESFGYRNERAVTAALCARLHGRARAVGTSFLSGSQCKSEVLKICRVAKRRLVTVPTLASWADVKSTVPKAVSSSPNSSVTNESLTTTTHAQIPDSFWSDLQEASLWQRDKSKWNIEQCRAVVTRYDSYLNQLVDSHHYLLQPQPQPSLHPPQQQHTVDDSASAITSSPSQPVPPLSDACMERLLSAETVTTAFKALIKCHFASPTDLAGTVRQWERHIGRLGRTPLTDHLSLRLLTANAKAGNLGRCLSLLELRGQRRFRPRLREFLYTITALQVAASTATTAATIEAASNSKGATASVPPPLRSKNLFVPDRDQPILDNPTRWLDAILLYMKQRNFPLSTALANRMLTCYAGTGYTGKASHHFYRVARYPVKSANDMIEKSDSASSPLSQRPRDWFYVPELGRHTFDETQVKLVYSQQPPPFYKIPAQVRGKLLFRADDNHGGGQFRLERETEPEYSIPLAAAFAFADSLQQGACGHDPVVFNVGSYNALIKVCVYRGALWRAMHVLDTMLPNAPLVVDHRGGVGVKLQPNHISYNLLLAGLARVGDVVTAQQYYHKMINESGLEPDPFTVRAIVDGLLNLADVPAAVTVVQDFFNQHSVLPPFNTHCKILEVALGRGMIYEAKRYVYFIQQLWHWKPVPNYAGYTPQFLQLIRATQRHEQLQRPALEKLFAYFGETLDDSDFL